MEKWCCMVCYSDSNYPLVCVPCGHTICENCYKIIDICPKCRSLITNTAPNYEIGVINNLEYKPKNIEINKPRLFITALLTTIPLTTLFLFGIFMPSYELIKTKKVIENMCNVDYCNTTLNPCSFDLSKYCYKTILNLSINSINYTIYDQQTYALNCFELKQIKCYYYSDNFYSLSIHQEDFDNYTKYYNNTKLILVSIMISSGISIIIIIYFTYFIIDIKLTKLKKNKN